MAPRYDPQRVREEVLRALVRSATDAYIASGDLDAYAAASREAGRAAQRAADAERARANRWRALRRQVLFGFPACHYCGEAASTVDHLVPYSRGGADALDNLVPACGACNLEKLDFTLSEWRAYRLERGDTWPPEGRWARLTRMLTAATEEP